MKTNIDFPENRFASLLIFGDRTLAIGLNFDQLDVERS
jgi:hypothetical protein